MNSKTGSGSNVWVSEDTWKLLISHLSSLQVYPLAWLLWQYLFPLETFPESESEQKILFPQLSGLGQSVDTKSEIFTSIFNYQKNVEWLQLEGKNLFTSLSSAFWMVWWTIKFKTQL